MCPAAMWSRAHVITSGRPARGRVARAGVRCVVVQKAAAAGATVMLYEAVEECIQAVGELPVFGRGERSAGLERVGEVPLAVTPRSNPGLLRVGRLVNCDRTPLAVPASSQPT